jgi:hypothetical protein
MDFRRGEPVTPIEEVRTKELNWSLKRLAVPSKILHNAVDLRDDTSSFIRFCSIQ